LDVKHYPTAPSVCIETQIRQQLAHDPALAFHLLIHVTCAKARRSLGSMIAQNWSRRDINLAWNTIARSTLAADERQTLLNELWS
jgi:hypothetical protein